MKQSSNTRSKIVTIAAATMAAGLVSLSFVTTASAIECKGRNQVVDGHLISTPYCEDNYLAKVARGYGVKVSGYTIRNNPNRKEEVCRLVRYDNRVSDICNDNSRGRRHWFN